MGYEPIDWAGQVEHLLDRALRHSGDRPVLPEWANEAVADPSALVADPDPKGKSGITVRLIGYSPSASAVLVVIFAPKDRTDEPGLGSWGFTAWVANERDVKAYKEANEDE